MESHLLPTSIVYLLKIWPETLLALPCIFFVTWYLRHRHKVLVNWPIVGALPCLLRNAHRINDWFVEAFNENGGTFILKGPIFSGFEFVVTCDPHIIEYITRTNFANFPKGPDFLEIFDALGDGIFNVDSDKWLLQRRMAHVRFGSKNFRSFYASMSVEVAREGLVPVLVHLAKQGSNVDLHDLLLRFTFDCTVGTIFGRSPKYLSIGFPKNEFAEATNDANNAIFYRIITPMIWWKSLRFLNIGKERSMVEALKTTDKIIGGFISSKHEDLRKGYTGNDLLSTYINPLEEAEDDEAKYLLSQGDKFLRDTTLSLVLAGRDTVGTGLAWFFWLLSKSPHAETKILEELRLVVSEKKRDGPIWPWLFCLEDLKPLVYLHAALCEALRLYPPVPTEFKSALEDDVLPDGTAVRKGVRIVYSIYAVGRMKWVWGEDCMEFRPERWIDGNGKLRYESPFKYPIFNAGPRNCLGRDMALTVMKVAVSTILFNFHVQVLEKKPASWKPSVNFLMNNGMMVKLTERASF